MLSPAEFISKWRHVELKEHSAAQEHLINLFRHVFRLFVKGIGLPPEGLFSRLLERNRGGGFQTPSSGIQLSTWSLEI